MLAIVYLSVRPEAPGHGPSLPWEAFHKFGHLVAYSVLTYLYLQCFGYFELMFSGEENFNADGRESNADSRGFNLPRAVRSGSRAKCEGRPSALDPRKSALTNQILFKAFAIAVLFGAFNEFLQLFCPTRSARWWDVLVNAIGAGVVVLLIKRKGAPVLRCSSAPKRNNQHG